MLDGGTTDLLGEGPEVVGGTAWNSPKHRVKAEAQREANKRDSTTFGSQSLEYDDLVQELLAIGEEGGVVKKEAWQEGLMERDEVWTDEKEGKGVDAWTQVPCFGEIEVQSDTLSAIAMAYKVLAT